mmetsp:Transcript_40280/g.85917  ORF Transcript_40280/g.85917 Transcript_40280/m.85917 type:complete len:395 (-) Transcript_40280:36-1220(-)
MSKNVLVSASIGCLWCCHGCNAEKLRNAFTFLPPPPSYTVQAIEGEKNKGDSGNRIVYLLEALTGFEAYVEAATKADVRLLRTSRGEHVPMVWLRHSGASSAACPPPDGGGSDQPAQRPLVLLHSHGNATDIGMMMGPYAELSKYCGVEVVGVEYSGYGMATGLPSSQNAVADLEAAYDYLIASGVLPEQIVAYGQSIGSGPALSLASRKNLGGVIVHSPLLSGIKVIDPDPNGCCRPSCFFCCFDFYLNEKSMKSVNCPAFVIHGQLDDIIPFYHGQRLAAATPKEFQETGYFPRNAGHNDILEMNTTAYFREVSSFLHRVAERSSSGCIGKQTEPKLQIPAQVEMVARAGSKQGDPVLPSSLAYSEPAVGPEDGRYQQMRLGNGAREVKAGE